MKISKNYFLFFFMLLSFMYQTHAMEVSDPSNNKTVVQTGDVNNYNLALVPQYSLLATSAQNDERNPTSVIKLWSTTNGKKKKEIETGFPIGFRAMSVSHGGTKILTVHKDGNDNLVQVWDIETGERIQEILPPKGPIDAYFSLDDKEVLVPCSSGLDKMGNNIGNVNIYTIKDREQIRSIAGCYINISPDRTKGSYYNPFNPNTGSKMIFTDLLTGEEINTFDVAFDLFSWSPDSESFANSPAPNQTTESQTHCINLWGIKTKEHIQVFNNGNNPKDSVSYISFTPDSQSLITGDINGKTKVWDIKTGNKIYSFKDNAKVNMVAASAGLIASALANKTTVLRTLQEKSDKK